MKEYIEREYVLERLRKRYNDPNYWHTDEDWRNGLSLAEEIVDETPAADVVEVVRCKDCELWDCWHDEFDRGTCNNPHFNFHHSRVSDRCWHPLTESSWFCSYGKKKEGAEE